MTAYFASDIRASGEKMRKSRKDESKNLQERGISLVEAMVVMALSVVVVTAATSAFVSSQHSMQTAPERDVSTEMVDNVLVSVRAATVYDQALADKIANSSSSYNFPMTVRPGATPVPSTISTTISSMGSSGSNVPLLSVKVHVHDRTASTNQIPLVQEAVPKGAVLNAGS